ncbi:MAG TPA: EthD domain-containing protein [Acidimicrobiales bacterium]|nr:EthD domain-containing protein [Acidimicrobiales bacterium]
MIKLTFAVRRRTDIDPVEFHSYWRDQHGPLVRSLQPVLGIRRYVQTHRLETPLNDVLRASRSALEPFDGVAELWWDDLDALVAATSSPEGSAAGRTLLEDEARFIDLEHSALWLGQEIEIIP